MTVFKELITIIIKLFAVFTSNHSTSETYQRSSYSTVCLNSYQFVSSLQHNFHKQFQFLPVLIVPIYSTPTLDFWNLHWDTMLVCSFSLLFVNSLSTQNSFPPLTGTVGLSDGLELSSLSPSSLYQGQIVLTIVFELGLWRCAVSCGRCFLCLLRHRSRSDLYLECWL